MTLTETHTACACVELLRKSRRTTNVFALNGMHSRIFGSAAEVLRGGSLVITHELLISFMCAVPLGSCLLVIIVQVAFLNGISVQCKLASLTGGCFMVLVTLLSARIGTLLDVRVFP